MTAASVCRTQSRPWVRRSRCHVHESASTTTRRRTSTRSGWKVIVRVATGCCGSTSRAPLSMTIARSTDSNGSAARPSARSAMRRTSPAPRPRDGERLVEGQLAGAVEHGAQRPGGAVSDLVVSQVGVGQRDGGLNNPRHLAVARHRHPGLLRRVLDRPAVVLGRAEVGHDSAQLGRPPAMPRDVAQPVAPPPQGLDSARPATHELPPAVHRSARLARLSVDGRRRAACARPAVRDQSTAERRTVEATRSASAWVGAVMVTMDPGATPTTATHSRAPT